MKGTSRPLLFTTEEELELYRKQTEIELLRLPLKQSDHEIRLPRFALWIILFFGIIAFVIQFWPGIDPNIQSWGRNFLMVIIGGLTALLPTRGRSSDSR